jgi:hypothetical protein
VRLDLRGPAAIGFVVLVGLLIGAYVVWLGLLLLRDAEL